MFEILEKIGLNKDEIAIYTHLLKKGPYKATNIAKDINIARTTVYRFLDSLMEKGIVSEFLSNNVKIFKAIEPNKIPTIYEERIEEIKAIVPQLEKIQNLPQDKTSVELFQGKEGIKIVMGDIIKEKKDFVLIGEGQRFFDLIEFYSYQWLKKCQEAKIKGRNLVRKGKSYKISKYEEIKFLPPEIFHSITSWTYGDKTALFIWSEPLHVILINNKDTSDTYREYFEYLWKLGVNPTKSELKEMQL